MNASELHDTRIPAMFQGPRNEVRRKWRTLVRTGVREGNFKSIVEQIELVSVDSLEGRLIVAEQPDWPIPGDIQFGQVFPEICEACEEGLDISNGSDRDRWYVRMRELLFDGIDKFWFCLGLLAYPHGMGYFPTTDAADANAERDAKEILPALLRWWPQLQQLDSRIVGSVPRIGYWPRWGFNAVHLCSALPVANEEYVEVFKKDSAIAAETMHN